MDILEQLKNDHDNVRNLLTKLEKEPLNKDVFTVFQNELLLHNKTEEQIFYTKLRSQIGNLEIIIDTNQEEHNLIENIINYINTAKRDFEECKIIISILKSTIEAHILKEENDIFSLARTIFSKEELIELGEKFTQAKEKNQGNLKPHIKVEALTEKV